MTLYSLVVRKKLTLLQTPVYLTNCFYEIPLWSPDASDCSAICPD